jgi:hypothetical protein
LRTWLFITSRTLWGTYLILTSIYCLLAFLPYTFVALIKEPPYAWVPWFAHHQASLYFLALALVLVSDWPKVKRRDAFLLFGALAIAGSYLIARPFLPDLEDNWTAYRWSLISLLPLALIAITNLLRHWPATAREDVGIASLPYSIGIMIAVSTALLYNIATEVHSYVDHGALHLDGPGIELAVWSLISHVVLAIIVFSILNLIRMLSRRSRHPATLHLALLGALVFAGLWATVFHLLTSSLGFAGWAAHLYAAGLAATLTLWTGSLATPFLAKQPRAETRGLRFLLWITVLGLSRGPPHDDRGQRLGWSVAEHLHGDFLDHPRRLLL